MRRRPLASILAAWIAAASGCGHESGPPPAPALPATPAPMLAIPPAVTSHVGEGPVAVFGASVYSPGQEIYKALRQEDSLMAFLTCQGEPDRLEVRENEEDPGAPAQIILEYTRRSVQRGTVKIEPTAAGFYAARPIDPSGRLSATGRPSAEPSTHPSKPAPPPKPAPKPTSPPSREPEPEAKPETRPAQAPRPSPEAPKPTPAQEEECPIEPWRTDCRDLCVAGASWEWCSYRD